MSLLEYDVGVVVLLDKWALEEHGGTVWLVDGLVIPLLLDDIQETQFFSLHSSSVECGYFSASFPKFLGFGHWTLALTAAV